MDISVFFGVGDSQMRSPEIKRAKEVCQSCAVQPDCLIIALLREEEWGVWGGYAAHERRAALARNLGDINVCMDEHYNNVFTRPRRRKKRVNKQEAE